jgi:ABC-2 type transport system permease protein
MKKVFSIAWKDLIVTFRDRAALILMLAAPFALTLAMGFVTGQFSASSGGISGVRDIPVVIVNQDEGELGAALESVLTSHDLADLLEPTTSSNVAAARRLVEEDQVAAAVIIPAGFSAGILPQDPGGSVTEAVAIEVYTSPGRPTTSAIVRSIVEGFVSQVETGRIGGEVAVTQLILSGRLAAQEAATAGMEIGARLAEDPARTELITLRSTTAAAAEAPRFDPLAYLAPGMALLFLMYTVSLGGRSLLAEQRDGTLPRMLTTPTSTAQVLGGKLFGTYLTGLAQVGVLVLASALLFGINWGRPLDVLILILAIVAGATGWGTLLAAIAKTPTQVSSIGLALMLAFGILGGSFFGGVSLPLPMEILSKITPNAWGMDGFLSLALGGTLVDILPSIGGLLAMAVILFGVAVVLFRRRGLARA